MALSPGVLDLYAPKWRTAGRRARDGSSAGRALTMTGFGLLFWGAVFGLALRLLSYFRSTPGIGDLLALKVLSLALLAFFAILLLSNVITSLSTFFLARDLELLAAAPVDGLQLYGARLLETIIHSSWMVGLMLVPVLFAYAVAFDAGPAFAAVAILVVPAFLVIPGVLGTAVTQILVNVFPARRARDLLALVALFAAGGVVLFFRTLQPERLARPEGFRDLVDFIAVLETPQSVWLPSEWAARALLAPLGVGGIDLFPALLLTSTAAAAIVLGASLHGRLFADGLTRSQEGAEHRGARTTRRTELWMPPLSDHRLAALSLVAKDVRTFFRDTTQWSQLILLAVLVVVYIYNIRVLPLFSGEDVGFVLTNVISFLNLGLAGFVLAAIAARFLFPAISLEGRSLWLLRSSPLRLPSLVWSKYWVGVLPLLVLAIALTLGTNMILRVSGFMMAVSLATITFMTFALAALALAFGARFPKFDTENAADIPTGFGGLAFMMTAVAYLGVMILLEARPVYVILRQRVAGHAPGPEAWLGLAIALAIAALLSIVATVGSLRSAVRRVEALEP